MTLDFADLVNGSFEMLGALFIAFSVLKAHQDKRIAGVSYVHAGFFSVWGFWNLFYYPHLDQWWSFWGGLAIMSTNAFWLGQLIYYTKFPGGREPKIKVYPACPRKFYFENEKPLPKEVIVIDSLSALRELESKMKRKSDEKS